MKTRIFINRSSWFVFWLLIWLLIFMGGGSFAFIEHISIVFFILIFSSLQISILGITEYFALLKNLIWLFSDIPNTVNRKRWQYLFSQGIRNCYTTGILLTSIGAIQVISKLDKIEVSNPGVLITILIVPLFYAFIIAEFTFRLLIFRLHNLDKKDGP